MSESILKWSADTPQRLRRGDVFRVIDAANNAGCLAGFKEWLLARRPDLKEEVEECIDTLRQLPPD
jgi:hypothetical protein